MNSSSLGFDRMKEVFLQVTAPDGSVSSHQLVRGRMLLVGSGRGAGLELQHEEIGSIHCAFSIVDEAVVIRDWGTVVGTRVDGAVVEDEAFARRGSIVSLGPFEIRISSNRAEAAADESGMPANADGEILKIEAEPTAGPAVANTQSFMPTEGSLLTDDESLPADDASEIQFEEFLDLAQEVRAAVDPSMASPAVNPMDVEEDPWANFNPFESDEENLVRSELEHLQRELVQRESRIHELEALGCMQLEHFGPAVESTSEEIERLVERVEGLLDELEQSDERIRQLEESLKLSEEASEAEKQERLNLENWVCQIEQKVSVREEEWDAQRESLNREINILRAAGPTAAAPSAAAPIAVSAVQQQVAGRTFQNEERVSQLMTELERLRNENAELRTAQADQESCEELEREIRATVEAGLENELRQQQMEISTERAVLARQRKELSRQKEELQQARTRLEAEDGNADQRIRAFRDHLREIKSQEDESRQQKRLSSRIASLWSRLEGR